MGDSLKGLDRLERARLVLPYQGDWSSPLMTLEYAEKMKHFKGTGLSKQQNASKHVGVDQHRSSDRDPPKYRRRAGRHGSRVPW